MWLKFVKVQLLPRPRSPNASQTLENQIIASVGLSVNPTTSLAAQSPSDRLLQIQSKAVRSEIYKVSCLESHNVEPFHSRQWWETLNKAHNWEGHVPINSERNVMPNQHVVSMHGNTGFTEISNARFCSILVR